MQAELEDWVSFSFVRLLYRPARYSTVRADSFLVRSSSFLFRFLFFYLEVSSQFVVVVWNFNVSPLQKNELKKKQ